MTGAWVVYFMLLGVAPAIMLAAEAFSLCQRAIVWFRKKGI